MKPHTCNLVVAFAATTSAVLCTSCVTQDAVHNAVELELLPELVALHKGRYIVAQGSRCYRGTPPPTPPRISVLMAKTRIWIAVSYGDSWQFPYQEEREPEDRLWKIKNVDGDYDWPTAKRTLLEVRGLLGIDDNIMIPVQLELAESELHKSARIAGVLGVAATETHTIEIAAEEVQYRAILGAMDLAVATQLGGFAYTDPSSLPEWFME